MRKQSIFLLFFLMIFSLSVTCFGAGKAQEISENAQKVSEKVQEVSENEKTEPTNNADSSYFGYEEEPVYEEDVSKYLTGAGVTMIGDSIMNGNRKIILEQLPDAYIDAKGSRTICGGFEAAQKLQQEGKLTDVVIVELGTNGPLLKHEPYASDMQNMLELLGTDRQIFWVTVYCSYSQWMAMNNDYIWELSRINPNIEVIDWYSLAVAHPEWFPDGVHPNVAGARQFAKLLHDELERKYNR